MTSFYQFLIWFFTIVSLIALMYGVLSADITFIGLFICTLIISVIFYRLNETPPSNVTQEPLVKDFALDGIDNDNIEISEAIETLKQEQTKIAQFVPPIGPLLEPYWSLTGACCIWLAL